MPTVLTQTGITFTDSTVQTDAAVANGTPMTASSIKLNNCTIGFPSYAASTVTSRSYSTWYQAEDNLFVTAQIAGPYMNDFYAYAGPSTSTYYQIGYYGDNINNNTKWSTFQFMIKKGAYFYVTTEQNYQFYSWTVS